MKKTTKNVMLLAFAMRLNLTLATHSPGDGVTRYRFFKRDDKHPHGHDYHEGKELFTALGPKEAQSFLDGVATGIALANNRL